VFRSAAIGTARYQLPLEERIAAMVSSEPRTYEQRTAADAHVLVLAAEGRWSAVWLFWRADWTHLRWYVNLEQPIRRTPRSIQVRDCALDLVVHPNRSWEWKDRAEFDALCRCGFFPPHVASGVEAEARRMIDVIERWGSPFCDGWEQWRADPQLARPALPPDWRALER
jgi:protein associated with RNAse G/E